MKWSDYGWGIFIEAVRDKEDVELLRELNKRLPRRADDPCNGGAFKIEAKSEGNLYFALFFMR